MTAQKRALLVLSTILAVLLVLPVTASAASADTADGEENTITQVVNEKDGKRKFKLSFEILSVESGPVTNGNLGVAYASCEDCQTIAISVQVLLLQDDALDGEIAPENLAISLNEECVDCDTLALAHQFVRGHADELVEFTKEGEKGLREIEWNLKHLKQERDWTSEEIDVYVGEQMEDLAGLLDAELVYTPVEEAEAEPGDDARQDDERALAEPASQTSSTEPEPADTPTEETTTASTPTEDRSEAPTADPSPTDETASTEAPTAEPTEDTTASEAPTEEASTEEASPTPTPTPTPTSSETATESSSAG